MNSLDYTIFDTHIQLEYCFLYENLKIKFFDKKDFIYNLNFSILFKDIYIKLPHKVVNKNI